MSRTQEIRIAKWSRDAMASHTDEHRVGHAVEQTGPHTSWLQLLSPSLIFAMGVILHSSDGVVNIINHKAATEPRGQH